MLLKRCYISSFGKLQDFSYDFTKGLNIIRAENGWGKSTFAAFIRAMLYGMPNAGSRTKLEEAERRRYKPWRGGTMGGYLDFEANGKEYRAERTFGTKEAEDTFRLTDRSTNLESTDFSAELGKELFGLDKEAYSRSTYLPQSKISGSGMNDSIGKKLGRIAEGDEESSNFDKAWKTLDEIRKRYVPDRQKDEKGYVAELDRSIFETEERLSDCRRKEENAKVWREKERSVAAEKEEYQQELAECRKRLSEAAGYEALLARKRHYGELCQQEERLRQQHDGIKGLFHADVPEPEEISRCRQEAEEAKLLAGEMRSYRLEEWEQTKLHTLQKEFLCGVPEAEELQACQRTERERRERISKAELLFEEAERQEKSAENEKRCCVLCAVVLFLAATASAAGAAVRSAVSGKFWLLLAVFTVLAAAGGSLFLLKAVQKKRKKKEAEGRKGQALSELEACAAQGEHSRELLKQYGMEADGDITDALYHLSDCVREYRRLSEKDENYKRSLKRKEELLLRSRRLLQEQGTEGEDIDGELHLLENRVRDLIRFSKELAEASGKRVQFEQENPPEEFVRLNPPEESFAGLQEKEKEITEKLASLEEEERDCRNRAEVFEKEAERYTEYEERLLQLREELSEKKKEHFVLKETMKCLQAAKERFSSRYMEGLLKSFQDYVSLLSGEDFEKGMDGRFEGAAVDTNLEIRVSACGGGREIGYFSTGLRDLLGLCMRFALVDVLFEEEQPFLILDDPFVNLDEEKLKRALYFLKETAQEYQVLYLVCHSSRC